MASFEELFDLKSTEITSRAQDADIKGRGTMNKLQKIQALADEEMPDGLIEELDQYKKDLKQLAEKIGIESSGSKGALQARIANARLNGSSSEGGSQNTTGSKGNSVKSAKGSSSGSSSAEASASNNSSQRQSGISPAGADTYPDSGTDGGVRKPKEDLKSHFQSTEKRREAILNGGEKLIDKAVHERTQHVLIESLRPKDQHEPLSIQPSYMERHPDAFVVLEIQVAKTPSQVERLFRQQGVWQQRAIQIGNRALQQALRDGVSYSIVERSVRGSPVEESDIEKNGSGSAGEWLGGVGFQMIPSHQDTGSNRKTAFEIVIPHSAYRVHKAEKNPFRG